MIGDFKKAPSEMRIFRYLPLSPNEVKAFYVLAFGSFMGQIVAFTLALMAPNGGAGAIAIGGGLAIMVRFFMATWQFDVRRRRAIKAGVELHPDGIKIVNETGKETYVKWEEITEAKSKGGKLQIKFRGQKWSFGARELENGMALTEEIMRKTNKKSNFIPLTPI